MLELLKTRRSIRKFQDRPVEKEKVEAVLKSILLAPSSRARRPWEFIAVTDKETLRDLSLCRKGSSAFLEKVALAIVVFADKEVCDVWVEDCSIAAIIAQLSAHSMGLGSCWIQVRERMMDEGISTEAYIKERLNIPDRYVVECIIAIGYPGEDKKPYEEEELLYDKIHFEKY